MKAGDPCEVALFGLGAVVEWHAGYILEIDALDRVRVVFRNGADGYRFDIFFPLERVRLRAGEPLLS